VLLNKTFELAERSVHPINIVDPLLAIKLGDKLEYVAEL
jgi:hypothetical protein